jgi:putative transcriptional regulator
MNMSKPENIMDTQTPDFHPEDETLLEYVTGKACLSKQMLIQTHLQYCDQCRAQEKALSVFGGEILEETAPCALLKNAFAKTLALLDRDDTPSLDAALPPLNDEILRTAPLFIQQAAAQVDEQASAEWASAEWAHDQGARGQGTQGKLTLSLNDASIATLIKLAPNKPLKHRPFFDDAVIVILSGALYGQTCRFEVGDFVSMQEHNQADFITSKTDEITLCLCVNQQEFTAFNEDVQANDLAEHFIREQLR